jgi:hypothetical protein
VVVFRFAQGEATDPIDTKSFAVAVDGEDRSALFQVSATEAWGPIMRLQAEAGGGLIAAGAHELAARICSSRGACATVVATVVVVPPVARAPEASNPQPERRPSALDRLIAIARKLLLP